jgi:hypothetical protein
MLQGKCRSLPSRLRRLLSCDAVPARGDTTATGNPPPDTQGASLRGRDAVPTLPHNELPLSGLAPEAIDVEDVLTDAGDGDLEEALALGRFEEDPFLLGQAMPDPAIADLPAGRLPAAESLDVILIRLRHRE